MFEQEGNWIFTGILGIGENAGFRKGDLCLNFEFQIELFLALLLTKTKQTLFCDNESQEISKISSISKSKMFILFIA